MSNIHFLQNQLRAYAESWEQDHKQALECAELEGRIHLAIALYDIIARTDYLKLRAIETLKPLPKAQRAAHLREMHDLFAEWFKPCKGLLSALDAMERMGYEVQGAQRFREICHYREAMLSLNPESLARGLDDIDEGRTVPLSEFRNELRRRARA